MAGRADGLITDSLSQNIDSYTTGANVSLVATLSPVGQTKVTMTNIMWSIRNATAAAYTATMTVRNASPAGTVRASVDMIVPVGASLQDSYQVNIKSKVGTSLVAYWDTFAASVTGKVAAIGWRQNNDV